MYLCKKINGMEYPIQPIEPADIAKLQHLDRETLLQQLKLFIIDLLIHDFERLCALMYRHDVNERLFNEALMCSTDDQRAEAIANLVIDREMLKIKTRAAYSRNNPKNSSDKD
ncbi:MAG: hypothetical protein CVT92_12395 [Bacteroidetes bacterium HGW-Bacteroidetes-1]|nr:MAG: hypothetical protein CVT92_12395 [Bacteroidetes bacterium HGW-Bacteroidetes-1]